MFLQIEEVEIKGEHSTDHYHYKVVLVWIYSFFNYISVEPHHWQDALTLQLRCGDANEMMSSNSFSGFLCTVGDYVLQASY